jgi:hypothetical protein
MDEANTTMKKTGVNPAIIFGIVILVAIVCFYVGTQQSVNLTDTATSTAQKIQTHAIMPEQNGTLAEQEQCNTDGQIFVKKWIVNDLPSGWELSNDPTYYFSTKLNTCLAEVFAISVTPNSIGDTTSYSIHRNFIYEIYSNTPILQSETNRTCTGSGACTETLASILLYDNLPNLGSNDFITQAKVIMGQ